jgi:hypothetical protein
MCIRNNIFTLQVLYIELRRVPIIPTEESAERKVSIADTGETFSAGSVLLLPCMGVVTQLVSITVRKAISAQPTDSEI